MAMILTSVMADDIRNDHDRYQYNFYDHWFWLVYDTAIFERNVLMTDSHLGRKSQVVWWQSWSWASTWWQSVSGEIGRNRNYWNRILEIRRIWSNPSVNRTRNSQFFHSGLWLMEGLKDIKSSFRDECSHFHTLFLLGGFTSSASTFIDNPCKPKEELSIVFS